MHKSYSCIGHSYPKIAINFECFYLSDMFADWRKTYTMPLLMPILRSVKYFFLFGSSVIDIFSKPIFGVMTIWVAYRHKMTSLKDSFWHSFGKLLFLRNDLVHIIYRIINSLLLGFVILIISLSFKFSYISVTFSVKACCFIFYQYLSVF